MLTLQLYVNYYNSVVSIASAFKQKPIRLINMLPIWHITAHYSMPYKNHPSTAPSSR